MTQLDKDIETTTTATTYTLKVIEDNGLQITLQFNPIYPPYWGQS